MAFPFPEIESRRSDEVLDFFQWQFYMHIMKRVCTGPEVCPHLLNQVRIRAKIFIGEHGPKPGISEEVYKKSITKGWSAKWILRCYNGRKSYANTWRISFIAFKWMQDYNITLSEVRDLSRLAGNCYYWDNRRVWGQREREGKAQRERERESLPARRATWTTGEWGKGLLREREG